MARAKKTAAAAQAAETPKVRRRPTPKTEAPATKAKAAAKPAVPMHDFGSDWTGTSDVTNTRVSRTPLRLAKFGSMKDADLTERDLAALDALREQFGNRQFQRGNIDAGILNRLGERGYVAHVSGPANAATAVLKLTGRKAA